MDRDLQKTFHAVRVLVFDLDGTLIDSALDLALAVAATLEFMKRPPISHDLIYSYVGNGAPTLIRKVLGPGATEEDCQRGLEHFLSYYREHMLDNTVTYPGVREGLADLAHLPMAVLTNKPVNPSVAICDHFGLSHYFFQNYGGNSFHTKKPDPHGIQTLIAEASAIAPRPITPAETIMIGDTDTDVLTARNSGAHSIGCTFGLKPHSLADAPPDHLADTPADWLQILGINQKH